MPVNMKEIGVENKKQLGTSQLGANLECDNGQFKNKKF